MAQALGWFRSGEGDGLAVALAQGEALGMSFGLPLRPLAAVGSGPADELGGPESVDAMGGVGLEDGSCPCVARAAGTGLDLGAPFSSTPVCPCVPGSEVADQTECASAMPPVASTADSAKTTRPVMTTIRYRPRESRSSRSARRKSSPFQHA